MMNRPRPRKIVSVIKSSPSTESIEEKYLESNNFDPELVTETTKVPVKPQSPTAPTFSNGLARQSAEIKPTQNTSNPVAFIPRKPVVATLKKAHVPPPPTFSDSPKSSPISLTKTESPKSDNFEVSNDSKNSEKVPTALSPKSSGEAFLDAADKAADFIGGALLNSFKSFNLTDTTTVKMTSPTAPKGGKEQLEEDPFADIMNKLKSQQKPKHLNEYANLMDEEPPETFKQLNESSEVHRKSSPLKSKPSEPSSFIKAAFASKPKEPAFEKESQQSYEIATEIVEVSNNFGETKEELKGIDYGEKLTLAEKEAEIIANEPIVEEQSVSVVEDRFVPEDTENDYSTSVNQEDYCSPAIQEDSSYPVSEKIFTTTDSQENYSDRMEESHDLSNSISPSLESHVNSQPSGIQGFLQQPEVNSSSTSTITFFDSLSSIMGNSDSSSVSSQSTASIKSPSSPQTKSTGFRASILKHGLSALEKIGKSTADVVVSTRNKLAEPTLNQFASSQQPITPDYTDEASTFYDVLKLYGGYAKLQELQLKGVRASIAMKLGRRKTEKDIEKVISFDYQSRLKIKREISGILHPDRIMDIIDDSDPSNYLFLSESEFNMKFPKFGEYPDECFCIQKLLKSLDNILIISGDNELIASNRRRHVICQISTVFCTLIHQLILPQTSSSSLQIAKEVLIFTSQLIKYLQTNFARNCEDDLPRADRDQQLAIKLFLDISYSAVPLLQSFY